MPRKLRKYLPSHETIISNKYVAWFGPRLRDHRLWHWNRRCVAGGVAAGMFAGLIPGSNPVQFTAGALLAIGFRINLPVSVAVTLYSNPFTIVPLYYVAFKLGQLLTLQAGGDLPAFDIKLEFRNIHQWLPMVWEWIMSIGKPLLIGLPTLGLLLAIAGYFLTTWTWRLLVIHEWRKRRAGRLAR